ncbi:hypothetical protein [Streptomyces sp. H27-C3]|uniref:hypothetical protein n=1 Tax=Streptomyces sp. H27-C3 TaxID=3046305 RepID=UPI0024B8F2FB|nr:hypothetical protein [Streptomyces sp. H27-C3]MDJ0463086.1 hypothetical protein [Streptomyces sp. H27-C3]
MQDDQQEKGQFYHFGPFIYDVDAALKIIRDVPRPDRLQEIDVAVWARSLGVDKSPEETRQGNTIPLLVGDFDEEYARTQADLSVPLVFADLSREGEEPGYMLIDGVHRLRRASVEGVEKLPVYLLDRAESLRIRDVKFYR